MSGPGWRLVSFRDVPPVTELPPPDDGVAPEEREAARAELRTVPTSRVEVAGYPPLSRRWYPLRRFLGVSAFGLTVVEGDAGQALVPPHHEIPYGQEEVYIVLEGRARFHCDGEEIEAPAGHVLHVEAAVVRGAVALETPTAVLLLGGKPGSYEPPIWASDWRPPESWLAERRAAEQA